MPSAASLILETCESCWRYCRRCEVACRMSISDVEGVERSTSGGVPDAWKADGCET